MEEYTKDFTVEDRESNRAEAISILERMEKLKPLAKGLNDESLMALLKANFTNEEMKIIDDEKSLRLMGYE
tara:strand:- start:450 stop:662 length:213 start_codon:yes stop_codon:yes gene_type:complete